METPGRVTRSWRGPVRGQECRFAAGDTKVVNRGHGDGIYINTSGLGLIPDGVHIAPDQARPGDVVLHEWQHRRPWDSGDVCSRRPEVRTEIRSDTAPLAEWFSDDRCNSEILASAMQPAVAWLQS